MKKKLLLVLLIAVFAFSLFFAAACDNGNKEDTSDYVLPADYPETASEPSLMIHYKRTKAADYLTWNFWIWSDGADGAGYSMNYQDSYGGIALYPLSAFGADVNSTLGIIPRSSDDWNTASKDVDKDRMLDLSTMTLGSDNYFHIYLIQGDGNLYTHPEDSEYATTAWVDSTWTVVVKSSVKINAVVLKNGDKQFEKQTFDSKKKVSVTLPENISDLDLTSKIIAEVTFADGNTKSTNVVINRLFDNSKFTDAYNYDGELGAIYSSDSTTFRVWSPISTKIVLNIYEKGTGGNAVSVVEMTKGEQGVFETTVNGDLGAKYYTYTVYNYDNEDGTEIVDPYAKSAGLNGVRGQIVDFSKTNPDGWDSVSPIAYDRKELVVWETHVADVTSSDTWTGTEAYRKTFLGVAESGTTYTEGTSMVTTGFDHIVELGVNAVQLLPIFDQANDEQETSFNWGYNPLNYNVLEGSYSTDASDGYTRIREFKQLVQAFNGSNINIIMDVVYNHVNSVSGSNFDVLMPGYYFRTSDDGEAYNGSGCGNETASERSMYRKFMIDSVCFWAEEYKLGGFRFDLMGLHDIETMNLLVDELQKINPSIAVYGEPWTGGTTGLVSNKQAKQSNGGDFDDFGQFNDQMRDALIKGGMKGEEELGWITNTSSVSKVDVNTVINGLQGITNSFLKDPNKTVNYVTCHDNYTLYDRIKAAGITDEETVKKMAVLANSAVFSSNGTAFMLAGEELLRTKNVPYSTDASYLKEYVHNSYKASYEVNELNYSRKITYADVFENYKSLIAFKRTCGGLHLEQSEIADNYTVTKLSDGSAIRIDIVDSDNARNWVVILANGTVSGLSVDLSGYTVYLDTLNQISEVASDTSISPYQTLIVYKSAD